MKLIEKAVHFFTISDDLPGTVLLLITVFITKTEATDSSILSDTKC